MQPMLIYIHGFNSSPASYKARLLHDWLTARGLGERFIAPALPHSPEAAAALLAELVGKHPQCVLVGSSLGGYYATCCAERHGLRAVLVNPAVRPYELLASVVGPQQNIYTGERYEFTTEHLAQLRALEVAAVSSARYLLMVTTGDEVLDYRQALARYRGARQITVDGSDHGFADFARYLEPVLEFCALSTESPG